jgi:hypothetical protein
LSSPFLTFLTLPCARSARAALRRLADSSSDTYAGLPKAECAGMLQVQGAEDGMGKGGRRGGSEKGGEPRGGPQEKLGLAVRGASRAVLSVRAPKRVPQLESWAGQRASWPTERQGWRRNAPREVKTKGWRSKKKSPAIGTEAYASELLSPLTVHLSGP